MAIFASIERADLRVVAADYPLLRALPGVNRTFIWVARGARRRLAVIHDVVSHLDDGGAVLILPAGAIEPDQSVCPHAVATLASWSPSIGLIARRVPDLSVVVAVVSGVLLGRYHRHPLTWIRRRAPDRQ